jgi:hypothetical protein
MEAMLRDARCRAISRAARGVTDETARARRFLSIEISEP